MPKFSILSLGLSQSNFLIQLYSEIKKIDNSFVFDVDDFQDISKGAIANEITIFENQHHFFSTKYSTKKLMTAFFSIIFKPFFWRVLFYEIGKVKTIKAYRGVIKGQLRNKHIVDKLISPMNHDILHFHYCTPFNLRFVHYLPKKTKVVCSFWGSDLYRVVGKKREFYVSKALNRANAITIQTQEMGVDLMNKFGAHLEPKITYAQFALEPRIYELMDYYSERKEDVSSFKTQLGIPLENQIIAIGYNASSSFNHMECLKAIADLPKELLRKTTIVLSLTYQRDEHYVASLKRNVESLKDIHTVLLHDFLAHDDIAKLRLLTDIQIQMPVSDALSGSVTEVLYAGNVVIAADWLPYAIFKRKGVTLDMVSDFKGLAILLPEIIKNLNTYKERNSNNASAIRNHFFPNETSKAWIEMYHKLLAT